MLDAPALERLRHVIFRNPPSLTRSFALVAALVIGLTAWGHAWLLSRFLTQQLFDREAAVSREFVQNVLVSDGSLDYLSNPNDPALAERFRNSAEHLGNMADVLRVNVYSPEGRVVWSSNPALIGQRFDENDELEEAMTGKLLVHTGRVSADAGAPAKAEHVGLDGAAAYFVETYIPVVSPATQKVSGVIEVYKVPLALSKAIEATRLRVAGLAAGGALLLYGSLFWLVRRGDRTIRRQQSDLVAAETYAIVGELASSVAHNIRNPLASIRAAAEVLQVGADPEAQESLRDILKETDRISSKLRQLLSLADPRTMQQDRLDLGALMARLVEEHAPRFGRRGQQLDLVAPMQPVWVLTDAELLTQVFDSLLANATEAMKDGGRCVVELVSQAKGEVAVHIIDDGPGISPEQMQNVMKPFYTSKPQGLGLGLPLSQRIVQRFGGSLSLSSNPGRGARAVVRLPVA